jgi:hypothetical protein
MSRLRTVLVVAVAAALSASPAWANYSAEDVAQVGSDEGHAGYETVPAPTGHGVNGKCAMVRTNKTLVKWAGQVTATGHDGVAGVSATCYLQVTGPGYAYTVARSASAHAPSAGFGYVAEFVPSDASVSVCLSTASATWNDGHHALYQNPRCYNLN